MIYHVAISNQEKTILDILETGRPNLIPGLEKYKHIKTNTALYIGKGSQTVTSILCI